MCFLCFLCLLLCLWRWVACASCQKKKKRRKSTHTRQGKKGNANAVSVRPVVRRGATIAKQTMSTYIVLVNFGAPVLP